MVKNQIQSTCFVAPLSANNSSDTSIRRYSEVFLPAIADAGLIADTSTFDSPSSPFIPDGIAGAHACFVDISNADPQTWFILGCTFALQKPTCIVIADTALEAIYSKPESSLLFLFPDVIPYPERALPSDYAALRKDITTFLLFAAQNPASTHSKQRLNASSEAIPIAKPHSPSKGHSAPSGRTKAASATTRVLEPTIEAPELKSYEAIALNLIAEYQSDQGVGFGRLAQEMHKVGLVQATSIAVNSLRRRKFITRSVIPPTMQGVTVDVAGLSITPSGQQWLDKHPAPASEPILDIAATAEPEGLIDLLSTLRFRN